MGLFGKKKKTAAVIVAAGSSGRMKGTDKITALLEGEAVIVHSVRAFENSAGIDEIVVVTRSERIGELAELCAGFSKLRAVVCGGDTRTQSAYNGVMAVSGDCTTVLIHDGARPLVTERIIRNTVCGAEKYGACVPCVGVKDTVKCVSGGFVQSTPDRSGLACAQTPQGFDAELIKGALTDALDKKVKITDDCSAVERLGMKIYVVEGDYENLKITTPEDIDIAAAALRRRRCR